PAVRRASRISGTGDALTLTSFPTRHSSDLILNQCPSERQTMLLSATMPEEVERLAHKYMHDPRRTDLSQDQVATDLVKQYYSTRSEEHTSELQSRENLVCRLLREKKKSLYL